MNNLHRRRTRLIDHAIGVLAGMAIVAFFIGTVPALIAAAVLVLFAAVLFAVQAIRAVQLNQISVEEVGGPGPNKGLGPKDLAMDLRVHGDPTVYRTADTKPGETP